MADNSTRQGIYPKPAQLQELPVQYSGTIPPEWEDRNGHVNVQFYLALYELGGWMVLEQDGFDDNWFQQRNIGIFDLEHHLRFRAEMMTGDKVVTYNRVLSRVENRFHGMYFIVNKTRDRLAATVEYVSACVDMTERRIVPLPEPMGRALDGVLEKHRLLSWTAPDCGLMKL